MIILDYLMRILISIFWLMTVIVGVIMMIIYIPIEMLINFKNNI